jgi:hypothetical protein
VKRALARFLLGLVLRFEGVAEHLDPHGYPKTIDVEQRRYDEAMERFHNEWEEGRYP